MTPGIGHNSGRTTEPGHGWRTHAWRHARKALLPTLPVEIVRLRVRRAAALGLPYRTYAGIRASTGHDLIGFLFSSNALRLIRPGDDMPVDRAAKLVDLDARRVALLQGRASVPPAAPIDAEYPAPAFTGSWTATRDRLRAAIRAEGQPADRFLVIGDTALEREWSETLLAAGYLPAAQYFATHA